MYKTLTISSDVPVSKLRRAVKNGVLSLSASELKGSGASISLHPESALKVAKARKANRGTRLYITQDEIKDSVERGGSVDGSGGSIWRTIWNGLKAAWQPVIKPMISAALDVGAPALGAMTGRPEIAQAGREVVRKLTGVGVSKSARFLAKGSDEAREFMKQVREKRKGGAMKAGSFRLS